MGIVGAPTGAGGRVAAAGAGGRVAAARARVAAGARVRVRGPVAAPAAAARGERARAEQQHYEVETHVASAKGAAGLRAVAHHKTIPLDVTRHRERCLHRQQVGSLAPLKGHS